MIASSEDTSSFACSPTGPRLKSAKKSRRRVVLSSSSHGLLDRQFAKIILPQLERTACPLAIFWASKKNSLAAPYRSFASLKFSF
ncbi:uncharacterized protein M6B38_271885 [Iris pallida]|uniref:Uncharacterized protein n=1 Tax=Iris pallida TaxID=29817 RepID=A0AAX6GTD2_IRIPA|nr:uncharacterized protein M6B38_345000 [Iris pallida]KAJ6848885.1 uncharacterized protein M6B38_271885 [Iris pallida]